jgi:hypothetical protein
MIRRTLSVVTLGNETALSDNYLKVTLAGPREANRIEEIRIGGLTSEGLCEAGVLPVFTSPAITARGAGASGIFTNEPVTIAVR